jgi:Zn finger protein HypA/HybF involved in hydrogenase expression
MSDFFKEIEAKAFQNLESIRAGKCGCLRCIKSRGEVATHMVVCPACGNKRCPRASDHNLDCTNSNDPGQPGSIY